MNVQLKRGNTNTEKMVISSSAGKYKNTWLAAMKFIYDLFMMSALPQYG